MDCALCVAQSVATDRIVSLRNVPLSIVNASPVGQPLRLYTGPGGGALGMELSGVGEVTIPLRLGIGAGVAASVVERLRIGRVAAGGVGVLVDMTFTDAATGAHVQNVGATGSSNAGLVVSSVANGTGTGIRIGGPLGESRPTLSTGIDITGGTGLRYNALAAGSGTAIDVGGSTPPRRAVDATASGTDHIAGTFRANMLGTGLLGTSVSGSYSDPVHAPRTGVRGFAATNSNQAADVITGMFGQTQRGGTGGTNTTSIAIDALAEGLGVNHAGLAIGARVRATSTNAGTSAAIGLLAEVEAFPSHLAIAVRSGDIYLGSSATDMPPGMPLSFTNGLVANASSTRMYDVRVSGMMSLISPFGALHMQTVGSGVTTMLWPTATPPSGTVLRSRRQGLDTTVLMWSPQLGGLQFVTLAAAVNSVVPTNGTGVARIAADALGSFLSGLSGGTDGAVLTIIVVQGALTLLHEAAAAAPADRLRTWNGADVVIDGDGAASFWYDALSLRWRMLSYLP